MVASQVSKKKAKKYICDFCLNPFGREDLLDKHTEYCSKHNAVKVTMPKPGRNILKFKNIQNSVECPVKIIFDFESFLKPIDKMCGETKLYQKHVPSAFCLYVVSRVEGFSMDPIIIFIITTLFEYGAISLFIKIYKTFYKEQKKKEKKKLVIFQ